MHLFKRKYDFSAHFVLWLLTYIRHVRHSLRDLKRSTMASWFNVMTLSVCLSVPAALYALSKNTVNLAHVKHEATLIQLYLDDSSDQKQHNQLMQLLEKNEKIQRIRYISKADALIEFEREMDISNVQSMLGSNPLPAMLEVLPVVDLDSLEAIAELSSELRQHPQVEAARLNMNVLLKIYRMADLLTMLLLSFSLLLFTVVILVIYNTIRLSLIQQHRQISVMRLVGATISFIERPFLYLSIWYGFLSGSFAWLCVNGMTHFVVYKAAFLRLLPETYVAVSLSFVDWVCLVMLAILISLFATMLALKRYFKQQEVL